MFLGALGPGSGPFEWVVLAGFVVLVKHTNNILINTSILYIRIGILYINIVILCIFIYIYAYFAVFAASSAPTHQIGRAHV